MHQEGAVVERRWVRAVAEVHLRRIDVGERQRVVRPSIRPDVGANRVREPADPVVVALEVRAARGQGTRDPPAEREDAVDVLVRGRQERARVEVRPAFTHADRHRGRQPACVGVQAVGCPVRELVDDDVLVQIAGSVGRRTGPDEHLHPAAPAVCRREEVGVVRPGSILSLGAHAVAGNAAAAEVVVLEVAGGFSETEQVGGVVVTVGPVEHVGHVAVLVGGRERIVGLRVVCEVEDPGPRARDRRVHAVRRDAVDARLDVVAVRRVVAVSDPAQIVERVRRFVPDQRDVRPRNEGRVVPVARARRCGRRGRGALARVDVVGDRLRLVVREVLAEQERSGPGVDDGEEPVGVANDLGGPGQPDNALRHRKIHGPRPGIAGHVRTTEDQLRAIDGGLDERALVHVPAHACSRQRQGTGSGDRGRGRKRRGVDTSRERSRRACELALGCEATAKVALEDRDAVEGLLELDPAHVPGRVHVVGDDFELADLRGRESVGACVFRQEPTKSGHPIARWRRQEARARRRAHDLGRAEGHVILDVNTLEGSFERSNTRHALDREVADAGRHRHDTRQVGDGRVPVRETVVLLGRANVEVRVRLARLVRCRGVLGIGDGRGHEDRGKRPRAEATPATGGR